MYIIAFFVCIKYMITLYDNTGVSMPHPLSSKDENGLLCIANMKNIDSLLLGYRYGIFPWESYNGNGLFYFPPKRYVIKPDKIKIPKSIKSYFNQGKFQISIDEYFDEVVYSCRHAKRKQVSTWINADFQESYNELHQRGYAHSIEVWNKKDELVGGLYGVAIGKIFTGESMFSLESNASRFAMISLGLLLNKKGFEYIDCQVYNPYLESFGGHEIDSNAFFTIMKNNLLNEDQIGSWSSDSSLLIE
jgi:leucyl/phenylalanyl-tRNA--protein transferase